MHDGPICGVRSQPPATALLSAFKLRMSSRGQIAALICV